MDADEANNARNSAYKSFEQAAQVCDALAEKAMTKAERLSLLAAAREWRMAVAKLAESACGTAPQANQAPTRPAGPAPVKHYRLTSRTARQLAASFCLEAPDGMVVSFKEPSRSLEQNALLHGMAADLSKQVPWCGQTLSQEQWKRFATAKLKKDRIVFDCNDKGEPDPQGGLVVLGASTASMSVRDVNAIIEWFYWMGAQHGVRWTHEARELASLEEMRR